MTTPSGADVQRRTTLTPEETTSVLTLIEQVAEADGVNPVSEHVVLSVRHSQDGPSSMWHLLYRDPQTGQLVGYANVDTGDAEAGPGAELAVHPAHRRRGHGRALLAAAVAVSEDHGDGRLRVWAHGDLTAAAALARSAGFDRVRVLFQMRRPLTDPVPEPDLPPDVAVRPFYPGVDENAWLTLNARAFADHPEQGRWTRRDLQLRCAEPWFDPDGFLLAERVDSDGRPRLVGFHWTKVHDRGGPGDGPIGEVYVLGVDPDAQTSGLGTALTLAGLRYLRSRGLSAVMLYVDESNVRAVRLYQKLGFTHWKIHVSYQRA